jgi:predicted metal-dependent hydrolase
MSLPDYTIRISCRAQKVSLHVSTLGAIEVVVPVGFDHSKIPDLVFRKQGWLKSALEKLANVRSLPNPTALSSRPEQVSLLSIGKTWQIEYQPTQTLQLSWRDHGNNCILLQGNTQNIKLCQKALRLWLAHVAHQYLVPWLHTVSRQHKLPFQRASVRGQKTLWASCSQHHAISLNYKLLFLPSPLVEYVFTHELCHTVHLNHSPKFWKLVSQYDPKYKQLDQELRTAWSYVPTWVEE